MTKVWKYLFVILVLAVSVVWLVVLNLPQDKLRLITCDVGQGDATLIIYKTTEILIDGGPTKAVLNCLNNYMPFWDREIEMVKLSHPQADHFVGLIDVFKHYKVSTFLVDALDSSAHEYRVLEDQVGSGGTKVINPSSGMVLRLGLIYIDIIWPTKEFIAENSTKKDSNTGQNIKNQSNVLGVYTSKLDPNEFSITANIRYKNFKALFTGDISPSTITEISDTNLLQDINYIKVPHHGSKNGLTKELLDKTKPEVAVISVAKNNSYGQPHKEILDLLAGYGVRILRTDQSGNVEVNSDGLSYSVK